MTISDEMLMAYADGELDATAREAVESAMREDPQIVERVARHSALRRRVREAYSAVLSEDVPERLLRAAQGAAATERKVVNLQDARAAREHSAPYTRPLRRQWRTAGAMAASVIVGVGVGFFIWGRTVPPFARGADGALVARGQLAQALSNQLAAEQSRASSVQIGLSFLAKSGDYCRTFALSGEQSPSGLACRHGEEWQVRAVTQGSDGVAGASEYRTAGSTMPAMIREFVEAQVAGEPLDQAGERAARQRDWKAMER
jgi:anti-sigma-K factor RskA